MGKHKNNKNLNSKANYSQENERVVEIKNPIEIKEKQPKRVDKLKSFTTVAISIISLIFSICNFVVNNQRTDYLNTTNFNIVQNLWQNSPSYTLYNESQKPLTSPPEPSYYMYIPAELYMFFKDGSRMSNLILLPVSYENVISQTSSGKTIDEVETSVLTSNFYGKLGGRDLRREIIKDPNNTEFYYELRVYPFLAIATSINYSYKDKPERSYTENFITIPGIKTILTDSQFEDLEQYTRNIAHFEDNEIKVDGDTIIYDTAIQYLSTEINRLLVSNKGPLETADKQKLLSLMGVQWNLDDSSENKDDSFDEAASESTDIEDFVDSQSSPSNFNGIARYLSRNLMNLNDPLYPER